MAIIIYENVDHQNHALEKKKHTRKKMEWRKSTQVHIPSLARSFSYHVPYHSRCVIFNLTIDTDGVLHSPKKNQQTHVKSLNQRSMKQNKQEENNI